MKISQIEYISTYDTIKDTHFSINWYIVLSLLYKLRTRLYGRKNGERALDIGL